MEFAAYQRSSFFKGGEVVDQVIGNVGKESIESMLNKAL